MMQSNTNQSGTADRAPAMEAERLSYSISEAAKITGLGKTKLYEMIFSGELPSCKIGNRRLVRRVDLEALLKSSIIG